MIPSRRGSARAQRRLFDATIGNISRQQKGDLIAMLRKRNVLEAAVTVTMVLAAGAAQASIYEWEWVDPSDPNQGKRQSSIVCPDGTGVDAVPGADFWSRNLTKAYLIGPICTALISIKRR